MPDEMRLYAFTVSHFCEKARWALDRSGLAHREEVLLPGLHRARMRRLGACGQVPVLRHGTRIVDGSGAILDYVDSLPGVAPLTPRDPTASAEARRWERYLDEEVGETVRLIAYSHALERPPLLRRVWTRGGPFWGPAFYWIALPRAMRAVRRMFGIDAAAVERDEARLRRAFERLETHLSDRRFLVGDTFSRADLTLAALAAPLLRPEGHPWVSPNGPHLAPALDALATELADSAAGRHVVRCYAERNASPDRAGALRTAAAE